MKKSPLKPLLGLFAAVLPFGGAVACGYDGLIGNPLELAFPGSLTVAQSTHDAYNRAALTPLQPLEGKAGLARVLDWLGDLRGRLEEQGLTQSFSVYLIESSLWTRFEVVNGSVLMRSHASVPPVGEPVLLTSEAALRSLLEGKMVVEKARDLKLVHWVQTAESTAMNTMLSQAVAIPMQR